MKRIKSVAAFPSVLLLALIFEVSTPGTALSASSSSTDNQRSKELQLYLRSFYADPAATMNAVPVKKDENGRVVTSGDTPFHSLDDKFQYYNKIWSDPSLENIAPHSLPRNNDLVENLVEVPNIMRTLKEMEDSHLTSQDLPRKPWSDSYWPMNHGMTGARYADPHYPLSDDWMKNFNYISDNPASKLSADGKLDDLAPSEKYDYLVGDGNFTLTNSTWDSIRAMGSVEGWMGICDGWSAGSVTFDEPVHAVTVKGASTRSVGFYPSDVKALSALLWAKGKYAKNFVGAICDLKDPPKDQNGRITAPECQGNNPATWHMSVVNQLGQAKKALIIDASNDYEIWNFPLWHYDYSYFDPQTLRPANHWSDAVIPYDRFTIDKFKAYRAPNVKYIVGISMNLSYMIEVTPNHKEGSVGVSRTVHYVYDLELDADQKIIGGEWYTSIHPDFMWIPKTGSLAVSDEDGKLGDPSSWPSLWSGDNALPDEWSSSAPSAARNLQPLAAIVRALVERSHNGN